MELIPAYSHGSHFLSFLQIFQTYSTCSAVFLFYLHAICFGNRRVHGFRQDSTQFNRYLPLDFHERDFQVSVGLTSPGHGQLRFHGIAHHLFHAFLV
ncbi:hypothetical protein V6N13_095616 [Hibiscus sabdariffa]